MAVLIFTSTRTSILVTLTWGVLSYQGTLQPVLGTLNKLQ